VFLGGALRLRAAVPRPRRPAPAYTPSVDPFGALGLPPRAGLTDDEVRSAWRRVAAATHPDRADGGDAARFAAAAAAYTALRTPFGRAEALAEPARPIAAPGHVRAPRLVADRWWSRVRRGRPVRLALRIAAATAVSAGSVLAAGPRPATAALITGALTWLVLTGRRDLAPARPSAVRTEGE
jgi:DnaJ domain